MWTTAEDTAKFLIAMINDGTYRDYELLHPQSVALMEQRVTRFGRGNPTGGDLPRTGRGLGLYALRDGWFGSGGSSPGFQCLARFNPSRRVGYVILTNVNAILGGGDNYASARGEIYTTQDALYSILAPSVLGLSSGRLAIALALAVALAVVGAVVYRFSAAA